jgi:REP element-mobilizing transposase RayT
LGARGYFGCSVGNVSDEMIKDYIKNHVERDDDFDIEDD